MTKEQPKHGQRLLMAVVAGSIILICLCGFFFMAEIMRSPSSTGQPDSRSTAASVPTEGPGVSDTVTLTGSSWRVVTATVEGATLQPVSQFGQPATAASGVFVRVAVQITNTAADPLALRPLALVDGDGREYSPFSDQGWYISRERSCVFDVLNPGLTAICESIFEVPRGVTGLALLARAGRYGPSEQIELGLAP